MDYKQMGLGKQNERDNSYQSEQSQEQTPGCSLKVWGNPFLLGNATQKLQKEFYPTSLSVETVARDSSQAERK